MPAIGEKSPFCAAEMISCWEGSLARVAADERRVFDAFPCNDFEDACEPLNPEVFFKPLLFRRTKAVVMRATTQMRVTVIPTAHLAELFLRVAFSDSFDLLVRLVEGVTALILFAGGTGFADTGGVGGRFVGED